jgi:hypothetical protein
MTNWNSPHQSWTRTGVRTQKASTGPSSKQLVIPNDTYSFTKETLPVVIFHSVALLPNTGHDLPILEVSISRMTIHHSQ